ncbi:hypothetical protein R3P38DRAFT_2764788 [Favolaschia claudopus]|uniref:Uncharacterized protein n=1 Tax=Favolaschia claudopus TaxID=2862362 RepID=A0AAW0DBS2_9AGAR
MFLVARCGRRRCWTEFGWNCSVGVALLLTYTTTVSVTLKFISNCRRAVRCTFRLLDVRTSANQWIWLLVSIQFVPLEFDLLTRAFQFTHLIRGMIQNCGLRQAGAESVGTSPHIPSLQVTVEVPQLVYVSTSPLLGPGLVLLSLPSRNLFKIQKSRYNSHSTDSLPVQPMNDIYDELSARNDFAQVLCYVPQASLSLVLAHSDRVVQRISSSHAYLTRLSDLTDLRASGVAYGSRRRFQCYVRRQAVEFAVFADLGVLTETRWAALSTEVGGGGGDGGDGVVEMRGRARWRWEVRGSNE